MGEQQVRKPEEPQKEKSVAEQPKPEKPVAAAEEKKSEKTKADEKAPPQEIVLKVFMHCEGCARKVRRCLKGFEGVEDVITDCKTSKVVVKGEKADPLNVLDRVQRKSHRQVQLISPIPKPPAEEPKKPQAPKVEEKKEEPVVITVVLGVYMHCDACAQEIKKRIMRMKGVESAEPDIKSSQVKVKGVYEPEKLVDYIHKRTGKHATIVKVEPEKKEEEKAKEGKEDKKPKEEKESKNEEAKKESKEGGGDPPAAEEKPEREDNKLELKKNELYQNYYPENHQVYPQRFVQEYIAYPPQIFSDENPNACSVM